jgi:hypothetical protein
MEQGMRPLFLYEYETLTLVVMINEDSERLKLSVKEANEYVLQKYGIAVNFADID